MSWIVEMVVRSVVAGEERVVVDGPWSQTITVGVTTVVTVTLTRLLMSVAGTEETPGIRRRMVEVGVRTTQCSPSLSKQEGPRLVRTILTQIPTVVLLEKGTSLPSTYPRSRTRFGEYRATVRMETGDSGDDRNSHSKLVYKTGTDRWGRGTGVTVSRHLQSGEGRN